MANRTIWVLTDGKIGMVNQAVGLPVAPPANITAQAMLEAMSSDKKVSGGKVRYIVLSQLGEAVVAEIVTDDAIARVIDA